MISNEEKKVCPIFPPDLVGKLKVEQTSLPWGKVEAKIKVKKIYEIGRQ